MVKGVERTIYIRKTSTQSPVFKRTKAIDSEVTGFLKKGVIRKITHSKKVNTYLQSLLDRKKDNKWSMILNLKRLNKNVQYHHFKMETIKYALALVIPNILFAHLILRMQ